MKHRAPTKRSKYWIEPTLYKHAISWCLCYPAWIKELETLPDANKGIDYSKDKVQSSGNYDTTSETAMKRVELERKVNILETTAKVVAGDLSEWIVRGVTEEEVRADDLIAQGMPCCKSVFYKLRQKFYYMIARKI